MTCYKNVLDSGPKSDIVRRSNYSASLHAMLVTLVGVSTQLAVRVLTSRLKMRKIDLTNFHVATSETARDINRRIVLNLLRSNEPVSRADLARHSGLQRSTVSIIIEQLIGERWVTQGANGRAPRGRRPRFLHLNKERLRIIGVNVRPATTTVALADLDARFVAQESLPTAKTPEQFVAD